MSRESSQLQKKFAEAMTTGKLMVQSKVLGEVHVFTIVSEGGKEKRVNVSVPSSSSVDLIAYAPLAAWRKSSSLRENVSKGFLKVV